jgi:hypothetical protein
MSFEGDPCEHDASRRAENALARLGGAWAAGEMRIPPTLGAAPVGMLEPGVREAMETGFQHDFSKVRVFTGGVADVARVGAQAVTVDHDIYFAPGEYRLDLLAHELAHVVQRDLGAPSMAYRNGRRDLRRVESALRQATTTLRRSARFLRAQPVHALVDSMVSVLSAFFPTGYGRVDQQGAIVRPSQTIFLDQPVRRGGVTGTYRHELKLYLSDERPSEEARYQPNAAGGEIRVFLNNVLTLTEPELIAVLAHELVHLFSNVIARGEQYGARLRATQPPLPSAAGAGGRPVSVSIALADPTLGHDSGFEVQLLALHHAYEPVVDYLNQHRAMRGAAALDRLAVAAGWAAATGEELLAYVIDQQIDIGVQLATGTGRARVAFTVPLNPLAFFRTYIGRHWLSDPQDRAALRLPEAEPILQRAGNSAEMRAVYDAIVQRVTTPTP